MKLLSIRCNGFNNIISLAYNRYTFILFFFWHNFFYLDNLPDREMWHFQKVSMPGRKVVRYRKPHIYSFIYI